MDGINVEAIKVHIKYAAERSLEGAKWFVEGQEPMSMLVASGVIVLTARVALNALKGESTKPIEVFLMVTSGVGYTHTKQNGALMLEIASIRRTVNDLKQEQAQMKATLQTILSKVEGG